MWDITKPVDRRNEALLAAHPAHTGRIWGLAWSPDGKLLATAGADRTVKLWSSPQCLDEQPFERVNEWVWEVAFAAHSAKLISVCEGGAVYCWDADAYEIIHRYNAVCLGKWPSLAITRDGEHAAVAAENDDVVRYIDLTSGAVRFEVGTFPGGVSDLAISPDGALLAVACQDSTTTILELPTGRKLHVLPHASPVSSVAFSPEGRTLVTCSRELRLWNVHTGDVAWIRRHHETTSRHAVFSPDGKTIATAATRDSVALVAASNGDLLSSMLTNQDAAISLAFSPDGNTLAVALEAAALVMLWDVRTHQELCDLDARMHAIFKVAFSPDGKRLLACGQAPGPHRLPHGEGMITEWRLPARAAPK